MKKLLFFFVGLALISCSNDESNDNSGETTNSVAFFKANVGGQTLNYIQDNSNNPAYFNEINIGYNGQGFEKSYYYGANMVTLSSVDYYPSLDLTMHNMYQSNNEADETTNFNNSFAVKPTTFISYAQDGNWIKGVSVTYIKANGDRYSTLAGSQPNSSIMYNTGIASTSQFGLQRQTITGTVTCRLYNENDVNDVLELTNGSFKLIFEEFN